MRILTLSNSLLGESSGSGYVVHGYAEGLRARGHSVDLLGPPDFEPFHELSRGIRYRQILGMAGTAAWRMARGGYDLVELYGAEAWLACLALTSVPRRRYIVVAHSNGLEPHCSEILARAVAAGWLRDERRWYQADLSRAFALGFRASDALVTVSEFDREYGLRAGYAHGRILALENPLPDGYLGRAIAAPRERTIGFVGAWLPRKGIELIARDVPTILREFPDWRFTLVGVGPEFQPAGHFPADVLPRIDVVPAADRSGQLTSLYERFAIVVLPSLYESFGLVASEAMACGAALVATPVGFAHALRDGVEALLLPEPVSPALAVALRRLVADAVLRRSLAGAGHKRVQRLRWPHAVEALEAAYLGWLREHRDARARRGAA